MRTAFALALYVSLAAGLFGETLAAASDGAPEWVAEYNKGIAATQASDFDTALATFERGWKSATTSEERASAAYNVGEILRQQGRVGEARQWLERSLEGWKENGHESAKLALTASLLADIGRIVADYDGAERMLREAIALPSVDPSARTVLRNDLADLLREQGRSSEALALFTQVLLRQPGEPEIPLRQHVSALIGIADIERLRRDWNASVGHWNEVLDICRREKDEQAEAIALRGLGMTWLASGSAARAEPLFRRALRLMESNPATPREQIAGAHSSLGELYRSENKLSLAEDEWTRALQIDRSLFGETHPQIAWLMEMLSDIYSARGEFVLASDYATRASEMMRGTFGDNSMPVAAALVNKALVEQRASDLNAAAKDFETALGIARAHPEHKSMEATMLQRYSDLLKAMHRNREAKALDLQAKSFQLR